jgi:hypothetical protein
MILLEDIGDIRLGLAHGQCAKTVLSDRLKTDIPPRRQYPPKGQIADGHHARIPRDHMIELIRQMRLFYKKANGSTDCQMFGGNRQFALHQAPGRMLRPGQSLLDLHPVGRIHRT